MQHSYGKTFLVMRKLAKPHIPLQQSKGKDIYIRIEEKYCSNLKPEEPLDQETICKPNCVHQQHRNAITQRKGQDRTAEIGTNIKFCIPENKEGNIASDDYGAAAQHPLNHFYANLLTYQPKEPHP